MRDVFELTLKSLVLSNEQCKAGKTWSFGIQMQEPDLGKTEPQFSPSGEKRLELVYIVTSVLSCPRQGWLNT